MIDVAPSPTRSSPLGAAHHAAAALAGSAVADRFCFWRGRSGRRYVFSTYRITTPAERAAVPRYADAIVIAAKRTAGGRQLLRVADTGAIPELTMDGPDGATADRSADELHIHLLAGGAAERRALVEDLGGCSPAMRPAANVLAG